MTDYTLFNAYAIARDQMEMAAHHRIYQSGVLGGIADPTSADDDARWYQRRARLANRIETAMDRRHGARPR